MFESFANSERYKTPFCGVIYEPAFESFANSERYKTLKKLTEQRASLRALLIQKDTKHDERRGINVAGLRALLIQKDTKLTLQGF